MYQYHTFGLKISSEIKLPECGLCALNDNEVDVYIRYGVVSKLMPDDVVKVNHYTFCLPNQLWLYVKDIAWFHIVDGKYITVEPLDSTVSENMMRLYLLGSCIGAIVHQRGQLIIHGNAVRVGDGCVIFTGNSGAGKSTTSAAFYQMGYDFLADDLCVVDNNGCVQPGIPRIKLWEDTANKLDIDVNKLERIRPQMNKYSFPIQTRACQTPLPLRAVYVLAKHKQDYFILREMSKAVKLNILQRNTYRNIFVRGLGLKGQRFKLCSLLTNQILVYRVIRPNEGFHLDYLTSLIKDTLQ